MKSIKKISFLVVIVVFGASFLRALNTRLFPDPQRGMDLNTAGILLRESMRKNDISSTRQALSTLRFLLDISWEELLRRLADGELNQDFKIVESAPNKKELQRKFYDVANTKAINVAGSLAQAEQLKRQIANLERQVTKKETVVSRLEQQIQDIKAQAQKRQAKVSDDATRELRAAQIEIGRRDDEIRELERKEITLERTSQEDLASFQAQAAKDMWEVRKLLLGVEQQRQQVENERDVAKRNIRQLRGQLGSLELDLRLAKIRGDLSDAEITNLERAKKGLQDDLEQQTQELQRKDADFQVAQQRINNQQNTLLLLNSGNQSLINEKAVLELEKRELEERLKMTNDTWETAAKELDEKIKSLENDLKTEKESSGKEKNTLVAESWKYFQQIVDLKEDLKGQEVVLKLLEKTLQDAQNAKLLSEQKIEKQKKIMEGKDRGLKARLDKIRVLEDELEKTEGDRDRFKRLNGLLRGEIKNAEENIEQLKKEKSEANRLLNVLRLRVVKESTEKEKALREGLYQGIVLQNQIENLKLRLELVSDEAKRRIQDAQKEIEKLAEAKKDLEDDNEEAKKFYEEELQKRRDELANLQKKSVEATEEIKNLKKAESDLKKENTQLKILAQELVQEAQGLEKELTAAKNDLKEARQKAENLKEQLKTSQTMGEDLVTKLKKQDVVIDQQNAQIISYEIAVYTFEQEIEDLKKKIKKSEKNNKEQRELIEKLTQEKFITEQERNKVIEELNGRERNIQDLKTAQNLLLEKVAKANTTIVKIEQELALSQDREKFLSQRIGLQEKVFVEKQRILDEKIKEQKTLLEKAENDLKKAENNVYTLQDAIEALKEAKENLVGQLDEKSVQIEQYKKGTRADKTLIKKQEEQLAAYKKDFDEKAELFKSHIENQLRLLEKNKALKIEIDQLNNEKEELNETIKELNQDKEGLKKSLDLVNEELQKQGRSLMEQISSNISLQNELKKQQVDFYKKLLEGASRESDLKKRITELEGQEGISKEELEEAKRQILKLNEEAVANKELLQYSYDATEVLEKQIEVLTQDLEKARNKVKKLTGGLENEQLKTANLTSDFEKERRRFNNSKTSLQNNITQLKDEKNVQLNKLKELENQVKQLKENQQTSKRTIKEQLLQLKKMQLELERASKQSNEDITKQQQEINVLEGQLKDNMQKIEEQANQIQVQEQEIETLKNEKLDLEEKIKLSNQEKEALTEQLNELSKLNQDLQKINEGLNNDINLLQGNKEGLVQGNNVLQKKLKAVQEDFKKSQEEVIKISEQLTQSQKDLQQQKKDLNQLKNESKNASAESQNNIEKLIKDLETQQSDLEKQQKELNKKIEEIGELSKKIGVLEGQVAVEKLWKEKAEGEILELTSLLELRAQIDTARVVAAEKQKADDLYKKINELALKLENLIIFVQQLTNEQVAFFNYKEVDGKDVLGSKIDELKVGLKGLLEDSEFMKSPETLTTAQQPDMLPIYLAMKDHLNFFNGFVRNFGTLKSVGL